MKNSEFLIDILEKALLNSGYESLDYSFNKNTCLYEFRIHGIHDFNIFAIYKKIVNGGWKEKPLIKRVQIPKIDVSKLPISTFSVTSMVIGTLEVVDKNLFVIWSLYNNTAHNTNKSCYVRMHNIFKAYLEGFFIGEDFNQRVWIADEKNLNKIFYDFLKHNNTTEPIK